MPGIFLRRKKRSARRPLKSFWRPPELFLGQRCALAGADAVRFCSPPPNGNRALGFPQKREKCTPPLLCGCGSKQTVSVFISRKEAASRSSGQQQQRQARRGASRNARATTFSISLSTLTAFFRLVADCAAERRRRNRFGVLAGLWIAGQREGLEGFLPPFFSTAHPPPEKGKGEKAARPPGAF
ncbi:Hypothetical predicted protein [Podarcis lilfordi]|uniref:Uncharacterized protein n=1 Tax=Podarcis lilfordi TaxID=74358 RepID=A0AA35L3K7_9SAUR|nr:Hypothetical predicted protein [Podarcis lilfordi]